MAKRNYSTFQASSPALAAKMGIYKKRKFMSRKAIPAMSQGYLRSAAYYGRNRELKFFDTSISFTVDATAEIPVTGQLSLIPQGATQSNREGNKCIVKSIYCHGVAVTAPGAAAGSDIAYMYLIQDTQCNGAAPAVGDANVGIFTDPNLSIANITLANRDRFKILKKWVLPLNAQAGTVAALAPTTIPFTFYKKCNIELMYDAAASTGALTTIRSNNIFLVAGTAGLTDDLISIAATCRLRFSDS